ncbi:hypothetical protein ASESINO_216 [Erwinia phage vB_EamM_Asesino]|uniref:Uncharacterized protein n=1 Tax=Erwinia phage vB_EamM_Asesino TaxID=1883370 RepID=A0A1B2IAC7_9CAUD|nr:hypothetical protein ASESINO_216 [Erwinia phage vB_EamM_Asesino]ANZ48229.1 hypothetical protein ASESINO_216 [Erwinia phage vB_EamM_Asesino]
MSEKPFFPTTVRVGETISVVDAEGNPVAELVVPCLEDFQNTVPMAGRVVIFFKGLIRKAGLRPDGIPADVIAEFERRYREIELTFKEAILYRPNPHDFSMIGWKVREYRESLPPVESGYRRDIYFAKPTWAPYTTLFTYRDMEYEE